MVGFTKDELRSALSEFATGVTVITTLDDEGQPHTMTANAFTSVCLDPPIILVCVAHGTHTYGYLENRQSFGVNFLNQHQQELGAYFAKKPEDRTGGVDYSFEAIGLKSAAEAAYESIRRGGTATIIGLLGLRRDRVSRLWRPHRLSGRRQGNSPERCRSAPDVLQEPVV